MRLLLAIMMIIFVSCSQLMVIKNTAIEKAVENGWKEDRYCPNFDMYESESYCCINYVIFSHAFA